MNNSCKESFLSDIVSVEVYRSGQPAFPIPPTVPKIKNFNAVSRPEPILDLTYTNEDVIVGEGTISVKQSINRASGNFLYIYNVEMTIESGLDVVSGKTPELAATDNNLILTDSYGTKILLYALPGTFAIEQTNDKKSMSLKISLTSYNDYIVIE